MGHQCRLAWWEEGRERTRELSYKSCIPNDCRTGFQYSSTMEMRCTGNNARLGVGMFASPYQRFQSAFISGEKCPEKLSDAKKLNHCQSKGCLAISISTTVHFLAPAQFSGVFLSWQDYNRIYAKKH